MPAFIDTLISLLLMPPTSLLALVLAGYALRRRRPRLGRAISTGGWILLYLMSTGAGALLLVTPLEQLTTPLAAPASSGAQAIVVLAAGSIEGAPDYGGLDVPDEITLARLRYAARLQHATGLPLLVSGNNGTPDGQVQPKAHGMARALRDDFRTPVAWIEDRSDNTAQNAANSAAMLKAAGIRRILLVTHAMHMARAERAFRQQGLDVVAAPTRFYSGGRHSALMLLPSASGLFGSWYAMHEWVGLAWYSLRQRTV